MIQNSLNEKNKFDQLLKSSLCALFFSLFLSMSVRAAQAIAPPFPKEEILLEGLYLRSTEIDNDYPDTENFLSIHFNTQYSWGFRLAGIYHIENSEDRTLQWWHYTNQLIDNNYQIDELKGEGRTLVPYFYESDFDLVMYEFGRSLYFKDNVSIRLHGGIEYAYIHVGYSYNFTTNTTQSTHDFRDFYSFNGLGPRIGLELGFDFSSALSLDIAGAFASLAKWGNHEFENNQIDRRAGQPDRTIQTTIHEKIKGLLANLDADIQLSYTQHHSIGDVIYTGGLKGIMFMEDLEDMAKWGGIMFGMRWRY